MAQGAEKTLRQMFGAYGLKAIWILAGTLATVIGWWASSIYVTVRETAETVGRLEAQSTPRAADVDRRLEAIDRQMASIGEKLDSVRLQVNNLDQRMDWQDEKLTRLVDALPTATSTRTPTRTVTAEPSATPAGIEETQENPSPVARPQYLPSAP